MRKITSIDDAVALVGHELGVSGWKKIDQQRINDFADVTEDRQWMLQAEIGHEFQELLDFAILPAVPLALIDHAGVAVLELL